MVCLQFTLIKIINFKYVCSKCIKILKIDYNIYYDDIFEDGKVFILPPDVPDVPDYVTLLYISITHSYKS